MASLIELKLNKFYSCDDVRKIIDGLSCYRKVTMRVNKLKSNNEEIANFLINNKIKYETYKDFQSVFVLSDYRIKDGKNVFFNKIDKENDEKSIKNYNLLKNNKENLLSKNDILYDEVNYDKCIRIEDLEIYKNGKIYLQSLSSMIPVYVLKPNKNENILDMCAAPGSKTTMIQSECLNKANVTALEVHKDRFERLKYNCDMQGVNVYLINQNAIDLNDYLKFDKILLDAPCSGSGIINLLNQDYQKYFTEKLIDKCISTQKKLIKKASKLLKKGGELVYSTCSLLNEENEDIIAFANNNGFDICDLKYNNSKFIKIFPDELYEGFFVAKLIRN